MNRRAFLTGLIATSAIAIGPAAVEAILVKAPKVDWEIYFKQWMRDCMNIHVKCWEDQIIYGTSAIQTIDTYPYIERIDPRELVLPKTTDGLLS